jgi:hypothetical protein
MKSTSLILKSLKFDGLHTMRFGQRLYILIQSANHVLIYECCKDIDSFVYDSLEMTNKKFSSEGVLLPFLLLV